MPSAIIRAAGTMESNPAVRETIQHFWGNGDESWTKLLDNPIGLVDAYERKLAENGRVVKKVYIESEKTGFGFVEFFSVWKTFKGSPWMKAIDDLQELYDDMPDVLSRHLDVKEGKYSSLDKFS